MNYFKIFILTLLFLICSNTAFADFDYNDWVDVSNNGKTIYLDTRSIREENDSLYYTVRYNTIQNKQLITVIQSKGNMAGIVTTYDDYYHSPYYYDYKPTQPTPKTATKFNLITDDSVIYRANLYAMSKTGYNGNIDLGQADFTNYLRALERTSKTYWQLPYEKSKCKNSTTFNIRVNNDGHLLRSVIINSSGDNSLDQSANYAIGQGTLFTGREFPQTYKGNSVEIQMEFNHAIKQVTAKVLTKNAHVTNNKTVNNSFDGVNFNSYMRDVKKKLSENWKPPVGSADKHTTVQFTISKTGELLYCKVYKSSGDVDVDNAAIQAVKNSKFKPLPQKYTKESIDVLFKFDFREFL